MIGVVVHAAIGRTDVDELFPPLAERPFDAAVVSDGEGLSGNDLAYVDIRAKIDNPATFGAFKHRTARKTRRRGHRENVLASSGQCLLAGGGRITALLDAARHEPGQQQAQ